MKLCRMLGMALVVLLAWGGLAQAQTWTNLTNQPSFTTDSALLLTDGTVMMHPYNSNNWWRLTPDNTGSYINGTWTQLASMSSSYKPLYFASAVLNDGKVIVEGGEYNNLSQDETNKGAFYDPAANTWTTVNPPTGWTEIGDSPAIVLANGTFMLGQNQSTKSALLTESSLTWTTTGTGKADDFVEEGMVMLPDQTILTVDTQKNLNAEKYIPGLGKWINAGNTIVQLQDPGSEEIGPEILLPNGTVIVFGANASGAGRTSIYTPPPVRSQAGSWAAGPSMPGSNDMADAPASILPDGNVLCDMSPGIFNSPVSFYEYNGTGFTSVPSPAHDGTTSYEGRMLALPTGQILFSVADGSTKDVAVYTPSGTANPVWAPTITSVPTTLTHGNSYIIKGTQFNGVSMGAAYGDDAQMNSAYPLVRITNTATGHVFYAKTHNHSTMAVATGTRPTLTHFDVPSGIETGASTVEVVANGIASGPVTVNVN
jgi:hypothetical protein